MIIISQDTRNKLDRLRYLNDAGEADEEAVSAEMMDTIRVLRTELAAEFLPVIQSLIDVGLLTAARTPGMEWAADNDVPAWDIHGAECDGTIWLFLGIPLVEEG